MKYQGGISVRSVLLLKAVVKCLCHLVRPRRETAVSIGLLMSPLVTRLGFACKQSKVADWQACFIARDFRALLKNSPEISHLPVSR